MANLIASSMAAGLISIRIIRAAAPFHTEQLEVRRRDVAAFTKDLERNGPRSVAEFARAEEIWTERARLAARARRSSSGKARVAGHSPNRRRRPEHQTRV